MRIRRIETISGNLILSLTLAFVMLACDNGGDKSEPSGTSAEIGPEGGSITTDSGAAIVIPPGALERTETIALTYHETLDDLPNADTAYIMGWYLGGVSLGPDGLEFASPVTITIPLNQTLPAGEEYVLFHYDDGTSNDAVYPEDYMGWQQTDVRGTVSEDGRSLVAQVDHFSTYVIQMNFGQHTLDVLGEAVARFGDNGWEVDFNNYQSYFESHVAQIGEKHAFNLPTPFLYDCFEVVGIDYRLAYDAGNVPFEFLHNFKGSKGEVAFFYNYTGDRSFGDGRQYLYYLFIFVYKDRTPSALSLSSDSTLLRFEEVTGVNANLTCGDDRMKNQEIRFAVDALGTVDPASVATDTNGVATTDFAAGIQEGVATVTGEVTARRKSQTETVSASTEIEIARITSWYIEMRIELFAETETLRLEATYDEIDFEFTIREFDEYNMRIDYTPFTARQDVKLTSLDACWFFTNIDAPSELHLMLEGYVLKLDNTMELIIDKDADIGETTAFFGYEECTHLFCDTDQRLICNTIRGIEDLAVLPHFSPIPVSLVEGTYVGQGSTSLDYIEMNYEITLTPTE